MSATVISFAVHREPCDRRIVLAKVILHAGAEAGGYTMEEMCGPRTGDGLADYRMATAFLIAKYCAHLSLPAIGRIMNRDHTSVLNAKKKVRADLLAGGRRFGFIVAEIEARLG